MTYNYTKTVSAGQLQNEIQASAITIAIDNIQTVGDDVTITFKASLSVGEESVLTGLVSAHVIAPVEPSVQQVTIPSLTDSANNIKATLQPRVGSGLTVITHNFSDPKSWYSNSTRVVDKTLSPAVESVYDVYSFADEVIDMENGRVTFEDRVKDATTGLTYVPIIKVNGVTVTTGFTKNYTDNTITFSTPLTVSDVVTATFYKVNDSTFVIKPSAGKQIKIENVEVQFSYNVDFLSRWMVFETWVYNPNDLPNKVMYDRATYKSVRDYINESNNKTSVLMTAVGELTKDIQIFTWEYPASRVAKASQGTEIRIYVKDVATGVKNLPVAAKSGTGTLEVATATFYSLSETEV